MRSTMEHGMEPTMTVFGDSGNGIRNTEYGKTLPVWMPHAIASCVVLGALFWGLLSKMVFNAFLSQISDFISWACLSSSARGLKCSAGAVADADASRRGQRQLPARYHLSRSLIKRPPLKKKKNKKTKGPPCIGNICKSYTQHVTHCRAGWPSTSSSPSPAPPPTQLSFNYEIVN